MSISIQTVLKACVFYTNEPCHFPWLFCKKKGWGDGRVVVMVGRGVIHQCILYIPKHDDSRMITEYFSQDFTISFPPK